MKNWKRYLWGTLFLLAGGLVQAAETVPADVKPEPAPVLRDKGAKPTEIPHDFWSNHQDELLWIFAVFFAMLAVDLVWLFFYLKQRRRWNAVFKAMSVFAVVADSAGKIRFLRAQLPEGHGVVRSQADLPDDVRCIFQDIAGEVLADGRTRSIEYTYMGRRRHAEAVRLPKSLYGMQTVLWTSSDIDELYTISERFRLTLQSIGDGVIVTDADEKIVLLNPLAAQLTGYTAGECVGRKLDEIFNIVSYINDQKVASPLSKAIASGKVVELANHTDLIARDGSRHHIADSASPIRDGRNSITGGVLIFRDVTVEYENRDHMRLLSAILKSIGKIANFSYFSCDSQGRPRLEAREEFWPKRDGKSVPIGEWVSPEFHDVITSGWKDFINGHTEELYASYTAGTPRRFYEIRAEKSRNPVTEKDEYFGLILDVTHIREEEQRHRNDLQLLAAIMDNLQGYIFVKNADDDFRYVMANRKFREIGGIQSEDLIGKTDAEFFAYAPESAEQYRKDDEELLASGGTHDIQEEVPFANGNSVILQSVKSLLTRADGTRLVIGLSLDVTKQKKLENEREKLLEDLKNYGEQEKLLNQVWERLMTRLDDQGVFTEILKTIVNFMGAYTGYIYRSDFELGKDIGYAGFQSEDPLEVPLEDYPQMPIDPNAVWFKKTLNHEIWEVTDTETEEARYIQGDWNRYMPALNLRALCGIGLWLNGKYWGYIGFSFRTPQKPLTAQQKFLLASMAHIAEIFLERGRSRRELNRSEYEKHLILDTMNIPIMLFDPEMKLLRCNNAALQIAGRPEAEVYRLGCQKSFCGEECRSKDCPVWQTHDDLDVHTREMHLKGRDFLLRANPIIIDGKLVYIMKTMIDVTESNEIREKLTSALEQAQAANKAKSYFLATMSHEIRTPLNAVIGFSELLKSGDLPETEKTEYLDAINLAGNSLLSLINDVLDLSKLEAEQMVITPKPTEIQKLIYEILAVFQYKVQEKKLFSRFHPVDEIPMLKLDNLRLRQILLNLIGNAVKFTERGGITLTVDFQRNGGEEDTGSLSIRVEDTGIGITEEAQRRIFQPFVQSDAVRDTHVYNGTGLGLAISRRLAERMGGKIQLESEVGKGSCFTLLLDKIKLAEKKNCDAKTKTVKLPCRKIRVLLVDDVPMNLKVLAAILHKLNVESVCAVSGKEALDILEKDADFKLILTDLWMPGMGGVELVQRIHENPAASRIPAVVVSADTQISETTAAVFQGILPKPITLDKLRKLLENYFSGS